MELRERNGTGTVGWGTFLPPNTNLEIVDIRQHYLSEICSLLLELYYLGKQLPFFNHLRIHQFCPFEYSLLPSRKFFPLSEKKKIRYFPFKRQRRNRETWYIQKTFNATASCHLPSGGNLSLSFLLNWLPAYLGTEYTAFCHTHTHSHTNQPAAERATGGGRLLASVSLDLEASLPNEGQSQLFPGLTPV